MIAALIRWSVDNRPLVFLMAGFLCVTGILAVRSLPLDAVPDLSDVQVVVRTSYAGQAPQVVEDQVTYPLSSAMLSVPGAVSVRGYSFFGDSYVYVIFSDDTDLYWARSRVLEYLNQVSEQLPAAAKPKLGPDATGLGWIYEYALVDRSHTHDLAELRSLQDWFLKYELQSVPGVSEVAAVGGMVKQYQVEIDPDKLRGYYLTLANVRRAVAESNAERSGSVLELAEAEYPVRLKGYISNVDDVGLISVPTLERRLSISSVLLDDIARSIHLGPASRRGVADLDGEGEVVGGIVVMRSGENALATIEAVKAKLDDLKRSLPHGVEIVETYNRAGLIERAVDTLNRRLVEELAVVVLVCALFLYHFRSSLVIVISLPLGMLCAFSIMRLQGINADIMSLGGVAIAVGAMVDASVVMIENAHKKLERTDSAGSEVSDERVRLETIRAAAIEMGPPLFFSLLLIMLSFLPMLALEGQEGKLFAPLAYTKTYAMAAAAVLSVTLVPALMALLIRGRIHKEADNPLNRTLTNLYRPLIRKVLQHPIATIVLVLLLSVSSIWPYARLGSEFMPAMDEGDLLYMPTTLPGLSIGKARELLQQTDRMIKTLPEVDRVFGKAGRADTATDPAPLTMMETVVKLKPKEHWRPGVTVEALKRELDSLLTLPGLRNAWVAPIRSRIDMQSTGINTPIGIKISGPDLATIQDLGRQVEAVLNRVPGTGSVYSERTSGARYIDVDLDRYAVAHFGLSIAEVEEAAAIAIGGLDATYTVEGRERYPVNLRYPRELRDSVTKLKELPIVATEDTFIQLQDVAEIRVVDGPAVIKSENAGINGWVYITADDRDIGSYVESAKAALQQQVNLPAGYTLAWTGQYQYMARMQHKMLYIVPLALLVILTLLYLSFGRLVESLMVMCALLPALVGGIWCLWLLDYDLSVATAAGFIALAGVAAEFGVVMIIYLRQAVAADAPLTESDLCASVIKGAAQRVRPKAMTAAVIIAGLLPIMIGGGAGSEAMQRIAAPMIGGMLTAPLVSMFLIPLMYFLWCKKRLPKTGNEVSP